MSREEANEIIRKKEERRVARSVSVKSPTPIDDAHSSESDSHVEEDDIKDERTLRDQSWSRVHPKETSRNVATGLHERLSGKGQGKA